MRRKQGGFILLTVLGLLVVLLIIAASAATDAERIRQDQERDDEAVAAEIDMHSTRQTLLYMLASQRMTFAGLTVDDQVVLTPEEQRAVKDGGPALSYTPVGNEIRLDGTPYVGFNDSRFALQSDRGLVSINWNRRLLKAWLARDHVTPDQQDHLIAALLDYQDPDDLYRLNGAEAPQYRAAKQPPPPNRAIVTPLELRRVLGWARALDKTSDAALMGTFTASRSAQICINTAPASVLSLLPGVTPDLARRVVDLRSASVLVNQAQVDELLPMLDPEADLVSLHPGGSGTLALWVPGKSRATLLHWTLTPFENGGRPWRIDYELRLPARPDQGGAPPRRPETSLFADTIPSDPSRS